jgi:hypothetical protein
MSNEQSIMKNEPLRLDTAEKQQNRKKYIQPKFPKTKEN